MPGMRSHFGGSAHSGESLRRQAKEHGLLRSCVCEDYILAIFVDGF